MTAKTKRRITTRVKSHKINTPVRVHGGVDLMPILLYLVAVMLTALLWAEFALEFEAQTAFTLK